MAEASQPNWLALFSAAGQRLTSDEAWSDLYLALWPTLLEWIISRYGLNTHEAEDILQDALWQYRIKLIAGVVTQPNLSQVFSFVRFCALGYLRGQSRLRPLDEIAPSLIPAASNSTDPERELLQMLIVDEALERMDQRCAFVMRAKYFHGFTSAEIGRTLNLRSGAVDTLLHRCRAACRSLMVSLTEQLDRIS